MSSSQTEPHPTVSVNDESHLNPEFAEQNFFESIFGTGRQLAVQFSNRQPPINSFSSGRYAKSAYDESVLGSGDFSVLKGGTFYQEGEEIRRPPHDYFVNGGRFYDSASNGRPFALPLQSSHAGYSDNPFADFKDFADITAGIDSDFSHLVAVYVNKNSSEVKHEPKNILEQLQRFDEERKSGKNNDEGSTSKPIKLSKFKSKLMSTKLLKEPRKKEALKKSYKTSLDYIDPLEADS